MVQIDAIVWYRLRGVDGQGIDDAPGNSGSTQEMNVSTATLKNRAKTAMNPAMGILERGNKVNEEAYSRR